MGRRVAEEDRRKHQTSFLASDNDRDLLSRLVERLNVSMADVIRLGLRELERKLQREDAPTGRRRTRAA